MLAEKTNSELIEVILDDEKAPPMLLEMADRLQQAIAELEHLTQVLKQKETPDGEDTGRES